MTGERGERGVCIVALAAGAKTLRPSGPEPVFTSRRL
jgi:hypothetical protein